MSASGEEQAIRRPQADNFGNKPALRHMHATTKFRIVRNTSTQPVVLCWHCLYGLFSRLLLLTRLRLRHNSVEQTFGRRAAEMKSPAAISAVGLKSHAGLVFLAMTCRELFSLLDHCSQESVFLLSSLRMLCVAPEVIIHTRSCSVLAEVAFLVARLQHPAILYDHCDST